MKKPYSGVVCRIMPKDRGDKKLRRHSRIIERILVRKANSPEMKDEIHRQFMNKVFSSMVQKVPFREK